ATALTRRLHFPIDGQRNLVKLQNGRATVHSQTRSSSQQSGARISPEGVKVSNPQTTRTRSVDLSAATAALWLAATAFLALLASSLVGVDRGGVSLFGGASHLHEFVHDARHLLGFPCH